MLSLAFLLFAAGVACLVRDGLVNARRRVVAPVRTDRADLERMFELPARSPRRF